MDKKFLVIVENAIDKEISNWWENDNATEYEAKVFEGFEDAKFVNILKELKKNF